MKRIVPSLLLALLLSPLFAVSFKQEASALSIRTTVQERLERRIRARAAAMPAATLAMRNRSTSRKTSTVKPPVRRGDRSSSSSSIGNVSSSTTVTSIDNVKQEVLNLVNDVRSKEGLPSLKYNSILETSAQDYAQKMEDERFFSHVSPDGGTLKMRMHASGYYQANTGNRYYYGENIARGQKTAAEVMNDWMNSPSHKAAILSSTYLEIGIGKSGTYWVQHFGAIN